MVNEDGTFKTAEYLKNLYESLNITPEKEVITYCGIGEKSFLYLVCSKIFTWLS